MLTLIITLLLNLGVISTPAEYNDANTDQQEQYQEIISDDIINL